MERSTYSIDDIIDSAKHFLLGAIAIPMLIALLPLIFVVALITDETLDDTKD